VRCLHKTFELCFSEETDLKCPLDKDAWLVRFLRPCKFYPESAFQLVSYTFCIELAQFGRILCFLNTRKEYGYSLFMMSVEGTSIHPKCLYAYCFPHACSCYSLEFTQVQFMGSFYLFHQYTYRPVTKHIMKSAFTD
jgi:hypothetical protein